MSDELDLDLDDSNFDADEEKKQQDRAKLRNKDLSDKLKVEAEARQKAEQDAANAKKETEFYQNFTKLASKPEYAAASEYQDKIKEKVLAGYDPEDAFAAVLTREGKYTPPVVTESAVRENPAGGSAANTITQAGEKSLSEMDRTEKKTNLQEALDKGEIRFGGL